MQSDLPPSVDFDDFIWAHRIPKQNLFNKSVDYAAGGYAHVYCATLVRENGESVRVALKELQQALKDIHEEKVVCLTYNKCAYANND